MKIGAPISMALLLVVALIGPQAQVVLDSAADMEKCMSVTLALPHCVPYLDFARSKILSSGSCCNQLRALASRHVSSSRGETCLCSLLHFDEERISSLMGRCNVKNSETSLCEGHGGPLRNSTSESAKTSEKATLTTTTSQNATVPTRTARNITASYDVSKDLTLNFMIALLAFLFSSVIPIYVIFHDREPREEVPTLNIYNMFSFILAAWYGLNAGDKLSIRISCLNGMQAILEFAHVGTCIFRKKALFKPTRDKFGMVGIPFVMFFGFIQYAAEKIPRQSLFAFCSTLSSLILLILPFITLRDELRGKPKEQATFLVSTFLQLMGNSFWFVEGVNMRDIPTKITSGAGLLAGFVAMVMMGMLQFKVKETDKASSAIRGVVHAFMFFKRLRTIARRTASANA